MNKIKFLGLAVVLTAFSIGARAQTVNADSLPSLSGPTAFQPGTSIQATLAKDSNLTVIIGHDTVTVKDTINIPSVGPIIPADHIGSVPIPALVQYLFIVLATVTFTVLPAIQAVLKVIPTETSVKIQGWIGKILDVATGFIKDAKLGGGVHS